MLPEFKSFEEFINESNLVDHAKRELELAGMTKEGDSEDPISGYNNLISKAVVELIQKFSEQGHSGMSASMVREIFNKLTNWENLSPITSDPSEWQNDKEMGGDGTLWQNKRNPAIFSKDGGKTWKSVDENILSKYEKIFTDAVTELNSYFPTFEEYMMGLNPGMNVMGMGPVKFPGGPGMDSTFHGQYIGSGDTPMFVYDTKPKSDEEEEKKRIKKLLKNKIQDTEKKKKKKDKK